MRGIEAALTALQNSRETREGRFIGETLRRLGADMPETELSLASTLAYAVLRRESLWREIFGLYVQKNRSGKTKLDPVVADCLLLGTAGILELRNFAAGALVNGLLEILKSKGQGKAVPMVNAIMHNIARDGAAVLEKFRRSPKMEERAMWAGLPEWTLPAWKKSWSSGELFELFDLMQIPPCASLRVQPGRRDDVLAQINAAGMQGVPSDIFPDSIRLPSTVLPTLVPGFDRGLVTVQTEGSMLAASLAAEYARHGGLVLDMCSGRGVKAGQIAQSSPAKVECWELSSGRHLAAAKEMARIGAGKRVTLRAGNALSLEPSEAPSVVLLDAPCSGSGTWNRKPESKWRLSWAKLDKICKLQKDLLSRALTLAVPGGIIIYVTCSLLRQENENIVAEALSDAPGCVVLDVPWEGSHVRRGRPWGTYIWPVSPWLDGFYAAVVMKRAEA